MLRLVTGIHVFERRTEEDADGRARPGHGDWKIRAWDFVLPVVPGSRF
jgi:hypothetical protein